MGAFSSRPSFSSIFLFFLLLDCLGLGARNVFHFPLFCIHTDCHFQLTGFHFFWSFFVLCLYRNFVCRSGSWLLSGKLTKIILIDSERNDCDSPLAVSVMDLTMQLVETRAENDCALDSVVLSL